MCVSAIAIGMSSRWPLLIAGNRDEFFSRPTQALHTWRTPLGVDIWGGRDLADGGGWMVVAADGTAAALVTNVRDPDMRRGARSRGQLPLAWVDAVAMRKTEEFWHRLEPLEYGGFNLICGKPLEQQWWYASNRVGATPAPSVCPTALSPGLYGLSNAALDSPWPKTLKIKRCVAAALECQEHGHLVNRLLTGLTDPQRANDAMLPDTGIGHVSEHALSSIFIDWPEKAYGTRSSHIVTLDSLNRCQMWEASYPATADPHRRFGPKTQSLS